MSWGYINPGEASTWGILGRVIVCGRMVSMVMMIMMMLFTHIYRNMIYICVCIYIEIWRYIYACICIEIQLQDTGFRYMYREGGKKQHKCSQSCWSLVFAWFLSATWWFRWWLLKLPSIRQKKWGRSGSGVADPALKWYGFVLPNRAYPKCVFCSSRETDD